MIIKTIERSASREYRISSDLKEWKGARMVAEINETEDEYECGKELERKVERQLASGYETIPRFGEYGPPRPIPPTLPPVIDRKAIERLEILIDDCTTMDELVKYKDQVGPLGLIDMYHAKFDQLMRKDAEDKLINNRNHL